MSLDKIRSSFSFTLSVRLKPHLHALKNRHGTSNYWHRAQTISARHYPFTRPEPKDFSPAGHGSKFQLAPFNLSVFSREMADRQQAIILHRALSVKRALHQNVKSRFREKSYRDLQGKLRRKGQKETWFFVIMAHVACQSFRERSLWMRPNNQAWFEMAETQFDEQQWYDNFRVTRDTFKFILNEIEGEITRRDTTMRRAVSASRRLAIFLYLSSTAEYRTIANLFGVSVAFVCSCIKEVAIVIVQKMKAKFITIPKGEELKEIMRMYKVKWQFPMCAGAIDGTHIPIIAPAVNHADYVNRKGYHSIVMQAVVDCKYLFRDVVVGWPGSVHDARILSNSGLYKKGDEQTLFGSDVRQTIQGCNIQPLLLGDPAYPLLPWLVKGYPENANTSNVERHFNYMLSRARMTVENTHYQKSQTKWRTRRVT